jgi:predicted NUDIX family NTP pyrophosphohydrolase
VRDVFYALGTWNTSDAVPVLSAALMIYRGTGDSLEVFLVHPGGPYWARKDDGAWSLPKGLVEEGELPLAAAQREFQEETGFVPPAGAYLDLGDVRLPSGKVVRAWAVAADVNPAQMKSNVFRLEWPPRSGVYREFPEADRGDYFPVEAAKRKLHPAQANFVERLEELLRDG